MDGKSKDFNNIYILINLKRGNYEIKVVVVYPHLHACLEVSFRTWSAGESSSGFLTMI